MVRDRHVYEEDGIIKFYEVENGTGDVYHAVSRFTKEKNAMYDERIAAEKRKADEGNA